MEIYGKHILLYNIISICSCVACLWLFYRYIRQMKKSVGSLLIVILGLSDFLYSIDVLLIAKYREVKFGEVYLFAYTGNFSICFSILWASAISFIVYKSISDRYSNQRVCFIKTLVTILFIALGFTLFQHLLRLSHPAFYCMLSGPLIISLMVTLTLYQKSISALKDANTYSLKSTRIYIRNLRYLSLAQLITYGPIVMLSFVQAFWTWDLGTGPQMFVENFTRCFASSSGIVSTVLFSLQGGFTHQEPSFKNSDDDLTVDITEP